MRKLLSLILLAVPALSMLAQDTEFKITGVVPDDVKEVSLLVNSDRNSMEKVAVTDGAFTVTGSKALNDIITIGFGNYGISFFNDGTPIDVDFVKNTFSGSELNKKLYDYDRQLDGKYADALNELTAEAEKVSQDGSEESKAKMEELEKKYEEIADAMTADQIKIVMENKDNMIPAIYINQVVYELEYDELKDLLDSNAPYYNHPAMARAKNQLAALEKRLPGKMFVDMTMNDTDGNPRKLSEWCGKGNYVLIDFWASWCGPCRQEMPNVVENYKKYHSAGFEIIGISFDSKADAWKAAIGNLGMEWPQLSDLKAWKSEGASTYGVTAIPANVLLDKDGKIIAIDLRGNKLGDKLKDIYGF